MINGQVEIKLICTYVSLRFKQTYPTKSKVLPELTRCYSESDYLTTIHDKEAYDYLRTWNSYLDVISDENYIHAKYDYNILK